MLNIILCSWRLCDVLLGANCWSTHVDYRKQTCRHIQHECETAKTCVCVCMLQCRVCRSHQHVLPRTSCGPPHTHLESFALFFPFHLHLFALPLAIFSSANNNNNANAYMCALHSALYDLLRECERRHFNVVHCCIRSRVRAKYIYIYIYIEANIYVGRNCLLLVSGNGINDGSHPDRVNHVSMRCAGYISREPSITVAQREWNVRRQR